MGVTFDDVGNVIHIDYTSKKIKVAPNTNVLKANHIGGPTSVEPSKIYEQVRK